MKKIFPRGLLGGHLTSNSFQESARPGPGKFLAKIGPGPKLSYGMIHTVWIIPQSRSQFQVHLFYSLYRFDLFTNMWCQKFFNSLRKLYRKPHKMYTIMIYQPLQRFLTIAQHVFVSFKEFFYNKPIIAYNVPITQGLFIEWYNCLFSFYYKEIYWVVNNTEVILEEFYLYLL